MASKKFYAVRKGFNPGIYQTWAECQEQTRGFKGQEFMSFESLDEAKAYMNGKNVVKSKGSSKSSGKSSEPGIKGPILTEETREINESFEALFKDKSLPLIEEQEFTCIQERPVSLPEDLIIYTDGSCYNAEAIRNSQGRENNGPIGGSGGYCAVFLDSSKNELLRLTGGEPQTTNNRMELTAIKEALQYCDDGKKHRIKIISDSKYAMDAVNTWYPAWAKKSPSSMDEMTLIKKDGAKADNQDLIKDIVKLKKMHQVDFIWTKGHAQNKYNEMCDTYAKTQSDMQERIKGYREELKRREMEREVAEQSDKKEATKMVRPARSNPGLSR